MNNQIKKLREERGLTQEALADLLGTSSQQVSRLERSERKLSQAWMEKFARALQVHPCFLIDGCAITDTSGSEIPLKFAKTLEEVEWLDIFQEMSPEERVHSFKLFRRSALGKPDAA